MVKTIISNAEVSYRALEIARLIRIDMVDRKDKLDTVKLYPVPRGGIPAAYAVKAALVGLISIPVDITDFPSETDYIIDDLIDSGMTRDLCLEQYPQAKFFALLTKKDSIWVVFPWETKDGADESATDIPLRLLQYIGEEPFRGGLIETPKRYIKAWEHFTSGYDQDPAAILKVFEDGAETYNEMVLVRNIPVYSQCEHHLVPFFGVAHIAYIPDGSIVGLSKLSRLVDIFARRLQVQERLTNQIAEAIEANLNPQGVAVILECRHLCMESRGISQQGMVTTTSAMKGAFIDQHETRAEFLSLIKE